MASTPWNIWVKWNTSIEQTLIDGHHRVAGDATIAEARAKAKKTGAHSLLDVVALSDRPFLGQCWVLSPDELHRYFGSKTPPKKAIEAGADTFLKKLEDEQFVAVIAYMKHLPVAVMFAGKPPS